jgi:hypothetical protein
MGPSTIPKHAVVYSTPIILLKNCFGIDDDYNCFV